MKTNKYRQILFSTATSGLLLLVSFVLAQAASQAAHADPGDLFVTPDGSGSACSQAEPCALQTALEQAASDDTVYAAEGTYTSTNDAVASITTSVSLLGGWDGSRTGSAVRDPDTYATVLDGEGERRVVTISGSISPTLDGLTIRNGNAAGLGGYGNLDAGGGVYINEANAIISHCTISNNHAGPASSAGNGAGGGIAFINSDAQLIHNLIISNTARWGGGVRVFYSTPVFSQNQFLSNTSLFGGGMYVMGSRAVVGDNLFQDNTGERGGGIYLSNADATIAGNVIRENQGSFGGGIGINIGYAAVISGNLILNNVVNMAGGGVSISNNGTIVQNNVIADNEAPRSAGVDIMIGSPVFIHNTIACNIGGDGVGISVGQDGAIALTNNIIVSHTVGISVTAGSTATLEATLWGSGPWSNLSDWVSEGAVTTGSVNVRGDPSFVNPAGGDYHIRPGSAAIDAGVDAAVAVDIDGETRPLGSGYDIGADEVWQQLQIFVPLVVNSTH
jgi:putative cofactor-binding repeat protein